VEVGFKERTFVLILYMYIIIRSPIQVPNISITIHVIFLGKRLSFTFFIIKVNKIFKIIIIIIGNSIR